MNKITYGISDYKVLKEEGYYYVDKTSAILEGNGERFRGIVGNVGFVKIFYSQIKEYCGLG